MSEIPNYENPHIDTKGDFAHLFNVKEVPEEMLKNHKRLCFLKLVPGMINPHHVQHRGIPVTPKWCDKQLAGDTPRVFRVEGYQKNYRGDPCYRIHEVSRDEFGRCASPSDVIIVGEYAVTTPPSWHQRKAGHAYGSIMLLWMTDEEAADFRTKLGENSTLHTRSEAPHIWDTVEPKVSENAKPKPAKKK
jgi:hypothetical protein